MNALSLVKSGFTRINVLFFLLFYIKFLLFDFFWCYDTTFSSFSFLQGYINKLSVSLFLLFPIVLTRWIGVAVVLGFLLDIFLISNLLYFRTYCNIIPLESYGLLGNLEEFTDSVSDSFHWSDLLFPLSTIVTCFHYRIKKDGATSPDRFRELKGYGLVCLFSFLASGCYFAIKGGILKQDENLQNANYFMTRTPTFTLFGSMYCEYVNKNKPCDLSNVQHEIEGWLVAQPETPAYPIPTPAKPNCVVILAESLESWVLEQTVEGVEITPHLNALLKKPNTIYAPKVLTQVKGGRSIDAQLLLHTGLLPIQDGAFSIKYPHNCYPSLVNAFKEKYPDARSYTMTVDKNITWNQGVVAKVFGFDSLIWKKDFIQDEQIGDRKKLGDYSFLKQCAEKIGQEKLWKAGGHTFIQCVTYSGHNPFVLPDHLKQVSFSSKIPQRMNDYMTTANYTDRAIGNFIDQLIRQGKYEETLIVITGDHEGLASDRPGLCATDAGKEIISKEKFTPFIILNAPLDLRYEKVMGQIDMYPTLLQVLGLEQYYWKGLGRSIVNETRHSGFAVSPQMEVAGDISQIPQTVVDHMKDGWKISDLIIKHNFFTGYARIKRK